MITVLPDLEDGVRTKDPVQVLKADFVSRGKGKFSSDEGKQSQIYNFPLTWQIHCDSFTDAVQRRE
jgi:hypothetical protein